MERRLFYHINEARDMFIDEYIRSMKESGPQEVSKKMDKALRYIEDHYAEDLGIDEVANCHGD